MDQEKHVIRPTDLAAALGCSVAYASQLLSGARTMSVAKAIKILDATGHKLGPIEKATDEEVALLRKFAEAA